MGLLQHPGASGDREEVEDPEVTPAKKEEGELMDVEETEERLAERKAAVWEKRKRNLDLRTTRKSCKEWGKGEGERAKEEIECMTKGEAPWGQEWW